MFVLYLSCTCVCVVFVFVFVLVKNWGGCCVKREMAELEATPPLGALHCSFKTILNSWRQLLGDGTRETQSQLPRTTLPLSSLKIANITTQSKMQRAGDEVKWGLTSNYQNAQFLHCPPLSSVIKNPDGNFSGTKRATGDPLVSKQPIC